MSEKKLKKIKLKPAHHKPKKKEQGPVEVVVYDCLTKQPVIAEYRNETKWCYSQKLYKVYHPLFVEPILDQNGMVKEGAEGYRWVLGITRTLGPVSEEE